MMRKILFIALALTASTCYAQRTMPTVADFQGHWVVAEVVGYAGIGGGVPYAKELLGQTMIITADGIDFDHDACKASNSFRVREVDTASELKENSDTTRENAELPAKAYLLDSGHCPQVYWLNSKRIEFEALGVFVRAYRDK